MDLRYPITRYLYRPVSGPIARILAGTPVTPVQVTWVSGALAIGGAIAFADGRLALGALLSLAGVITDCVDGDLARLTGRGSKHGAYLDSVLDRWTDAAMILGLGASDPERFGILAGIAVMSSLITSYTRARAQSLGVDTPEGVGGRDARILILSFAALAGQVAVGLVIVATLGIVTSLHRARNAGRALRRLDRAERDEEVPVLHERGPGEDQTA